jgi:hypothetical protein
MASLSVEQQLIAQELWHIDEPGKKSDLLIFSNAKTNRCSGNIAPSYPCHRRAYTAKMSGIFALGMIFFPTAMFSGKAVRVGMFLIDDSISANIHLMFSTLFFLALSFNSLFLFTKRHPGVMGKEKKRRNIIYRFCGIVMLLAIVCITIYTFLLRGTFLAAMNPVPILESVALFAFGISWLVKGHTLFKDK